MYSNRQLWRQLPARGLNRKEHDLLYNSGLFADNLHDERLHVPPQLSSPGMGGNGDVCNNSSITIDDSATPVREPSVSEIVTGNPIKRRVVFNNGVRVVLIPTVDEYRAARLGEALWWNDMDYKSFKSNALQELREHMQAHPEMNSKAAISDLYQSEEMKKMKFLQQQQSVANSAANGIVNDADPGDEIVIHALMA